MKRSEYATYMLCTLAVGMAMEVGTNSLLAGFAIIMAMGVTGFSIDVILDKIR